MPKKQKKHTLLAILATVFLLYIRLMPQNSTSGFLYVAALILMAATLVLMFLRRKKLMAATLGALALLNMGASIVVLSNGSLRHVPGYVTVNYLLVALPYILLALMALLAPKDAKAVRPFWILLLIVEGANAVGFLSLVVRGATVLNVLRPNLAHVRGGSVGVFIFFTVGVFFLGLWLRLHAGRPDGSPTRAAGSGAAAANAAPLPVPQLRPEEDKKYRIFATLAGVCLALNVVLEIILTLTNYKKYGVTLNFQMLFFSFLPWALLLTLALALFLRKKLFFAIVAFVMTFQELVSIINTTSNWSKYGAQVPAVSWIGTLLGFVPFLLLALMALLSRKNKRGVKTLWIILMATESLLSLLQIIWVLQEAGFDYFPIALLTISWNVLAGLWFYLTTPAARVKQAKQPAPVQPQ